MTHGKLHWIQTYSLDGSHVKVRDCGTTFCASVPAGMSLDDAIVDYSDSYSKNDPDDILCEAYLIDGEDIIDRRRFRL